MLVDALHAQDHAGKDEPGALLAQQPKHPGFGRLLGIVYETVHIPSLGVLHNKIAEALVLERVLQTDDEVASDLGVHESLDFEVLDHLPLFELLLTDPLEGELLLEAPLDIILELCHIHRSEPSLAQHAFENEIVEGELLIGLEDCSSNEPVEVCLLDC